MLFRHYFTFVLKEWICYTKKETCLIPPHFLKVPSGKCTVKPVESELKAGTSCSQSPTAGDPIKMRNGKGTPPLLIVRRLMNERENWKEVMSKKDYQYPGIFSSAQMQYIFFAPRHAKLQQSPDHDLNFMWHNVQ